MTNEQNNKTLVFLDTEAIKLSSFYKNMYFYFDFLSLSVLINKKKKSF